MSEIRKILLESSKQLNGFNDSTNVSIALENEYKTMPFNSISSNLSLNDLYLSERDACNNYKLVFTINPICSNVLFNRVTEILKDEGSSGCTKILSSGSTYLPYSAITRSHAINNTMYSSSKYGDFKYKCGVDFFNNHYIRSKEFVKIQPVKNPDEEAINSASTYNTIEDYARTNNLEKETLTHRYVEDSTSIHTICGETINLNVYNVENIYTMKDCFSHKCVEENGWLGFHNSPELETMVDIKEGNKVLKAINNEQGNAFIDLYPDRTLFSFIPKYNKYKRKGEQNWDCCITYPYENDYELFNKINENEFNAIKVADYEFKYTNTGAIVVQFKSLMKHNLSKNDKVVLSYRYKYNDVEVTGSCRSYYVVRSVGLVDGSDKNWYFNITLANLINFEMYTDSDGVNSLIPGEVHGPGNPEEDVTDLEIFYRKVVDGVPCRYYIRKFKKIENTPYSLNKLAFCENIYSDRVAQAIFPYPVSTEGLKNNLGMPLTDLYLTIVKANRGWKKWYMDDTIDEEIEYSHCFGDITSGIELAKEHKDYNVRCLHNVDLSKITDTDYKNGSNKVFSGLATMPKYIESGITIEQDIFYGDVVEYSPTEANETILTPICHRFNTAQRESTNREYYDIYDTEIIYDNYDKGFIKGVNCAFLAKSKLLNSGSTSGLYAGNIAPEGYFYYPHYRIKLKELDEHINESRPTFINYGGKMTYLPKETIVNEDYGVVTFVSPLDYGFKMNGRVALYDVKNKQIIWGLIYNYETVSDGISITALTNENALGVLARTDLTINDYAPLYITDDYMPSYATYDLSSNKFYYRPILDMSSLSTSSELYDMPYSNNSLYVHKNINFFVRRQDPEGEYELSVLKGTAPDNLRNFSVTTTAEPYLSIISDAISAIDDACE